MTTLSEEVQKALTDVAERLWAVSTIEDGYSILGEPRGLRSELESHRDDMFDGFPWEFDAYCLISMRWNNIPGSTWGLNVFPLISGRRLYVQEDDWSDQPQILSVSDKNWSPRIDRKFLQRVFRDNGSSFDTAVFGSPPDSITSGVNSFPFLVDLFVAGFDAAGQECWEALLEKWEVWNEDYENPENPIPKPSGLLREAEAEDIRERGQPLARKTLLAE